MAEKMTEAQRRALARATDGRLAPPVRGVTIERLYMRGFIQLTPAADAWVVTDAGRRALEEATAPAPP